MLILLSYQSLNLKLRPCLYNWQIGDLNNIVSIGLTARHHFYLLLIGLALTVCATGILFVECWSLWKMHASSYAYITYTNTIYNKCQMSTYVII